MDTGKTIITCVRKLFKEEDQFIPLHVPKFQGNEKKYMEDCIDSTFVSSIGKYVNEFENKLVEYTGAKHAVVCVNGTNAIHLCLKLVGVKDNDEVITQPLTFIATANAIVYAGGVPLFIDVDRDTMGLSPKSLIKFLKESAIIKGKECYNKITGRRIKACLPVHTFGHACRIEEILEICKEYYIELVEDSAEAMGSRLKGKHLGTFGKVSAVSFNGNKIITTGGGGAILTDDFKIAQTAKHLSTQAKIPHPWEYGHDAIGYNYRMPNINAALGLAQLEQLDLFLEKKRALAKRYNSIFKKKGILFFDERPVEQCNFWLNAIVLKDKVQRDQILKITNETGVMTRPIWKLMTKMPMFKNSYNADLQNATYLEDRVVNIPSSVL